MGAVTAEAVSEQGVRERSVTVRPLCRETDSAVVRSAESEASRRSIAELAATVCDMATSQRLHLLRTAALGALLSVAAAAAPFSIQPAIAQSETVLGAAMEDYSMGYGTARPGMITQNSMCANVVHDIVWDSWGGPVAHGAGTACQSGGAISRGEAPQLVSLTASDLGQCLGTLAYRMLQFDSNEPLSICRG